MSSGEEIIIYALLVVFVVGGLCISFFLVNIMDACSAPGERRRQIDLATKREASKEVYQMVLEKLFPPNKVSAKKMMNSNEVHRQSILSPLLLFRK